MNIKRIRQVIQEEIKALKELQIGDGGDYNVDQQQSADSKKEFPKGAKVDKSKETETHDDDTEEYITFYTNAISDIVDTVIDKWHYHIKRTTPTMIDFTQQKYQVKTEANRSKTVYTFPKDKLVDYAYDKIISYTNDFFKKFTVKKTDKNTQVTLPTGKVINISVDGNSLIINLP